MKCKHRFTGSDLYESPYIDECDYCKRKIPYCSIERGGKHKFTGSDLYESPYIDECDFCRINFPYCSIWRGVSHKFENGRCLLIL